MLDPKLLNQMSDLLTGRPINSKEDAIKRFGEVQFLLAPGGSAIDAIEGTLGDTTPPSVAAIFGKDLTTKTWNITVRLPDDTITHIHIDAATGMPTLVGTEARPRKADT